MNSRGLYSYFLRNIHSGAFHLDFIFLFWESSPTYGNNVRNERLRFFYIFYFSFLSLNGIDSCARHE